MTEKDLDKTIQRIRTKMASDHIMEIKAFGEEDEDMGTWAEVSVLLIDIVTYVKKRWINKKGKVKRPNIFRGFGLAIFFYEVVKRIVKIFKG